MASFDTPRKPLTAHAACQLGRPIIELFRPDSWRAEVAIAVREVVPPRAIAFLKRYPGEDMFADTMEYMARAYEHVGECFTAESHKQLIEAVTNRFSHLRGFHGCRPYSLESYFREGLHVLTRERLARIAYEGSDRKIPLAKFRRDADAADLKSRLGNVYFCADAEELVSSCGHYLIYGSESLCCMFPGNDGRSAVQFLECREHISTKGIPTVFERDVPIKWLPSMFQVELAKTLVTHYLQLESRQPVLTNEWSRNWGFGISRNLPARYIRGHFHPAVIPDPLRSMVPYQNPQTRCPWCATASG